MEQERCPTCGQGWAKVLMQTRTLVGYENIPGHKHDDNCVSREYECRGGHRVSLSAQAVCPTTGCEWRGKDHCEMCGGHKLSHWPPLIPACPNCTTVAGMLVMCRACTDREDADPNGSRPGV